LLYLLLVPTNVADTKKTLATFVADTKKFRQH